MAEYWLHIGALIEETERLDRWATEGPWRPEREPVSNDYFKRHCDDGSTPIESTGTVFALGVAIGVVAGLNDAALIARYRTLAPELARALRKALNELDTLRGGKR